MVHHRVYVSSEGQASKTRFSFPIGEYTTLNDFAGKPVNIALEWITPIAASDFEEDFGDDDRHPHGLLLSLMNIRVHNQYTSWKNPETGSILALLPGHKNTGFYGICQDTPYLQTSSLGLISHGDDLRSQSTLDFALFSAGSFLHNVLALDVLHTQDWSASLVFWTHEPERPLVPYDHFMLWLETGDRTSGTVYDCEIPIDLTTMSMRDRMDGTWNAAVAYISTIEQVTAQGVEETRGLVLECPTFSNSRSNRPILASLNRSHIAGEEPFYGVKRSVKGVTSDTIGIPLRNPIDNLSIIRLRILDAISLETPVEPDGLTKFLVGICVYRLK